MTDASGVRRAGGAARMAPPEELRELRRFHQGDAAGTPLPEGCLPALMAAFADPGRVRHDYPLILASDGGCVPLAEALAERVPETARVLRDNLPRLERQTRRMVGAGEPGDAGELVRRAGAAMAGELGLGGPHAADLDRDLEMLAGTLTASRVIALDAGTSLELLRAAAARRRRRARADFDARVASAVETLRTKLQVERGKDPEGRAPEVLGEALGSAAGALLDPRALARAVGPHRGSRTLPAGRRTRLQEALAVLEAHGPAGDDGSPDEELTVCTGGDACAAAVRAFDERAGAFAGVVRALRRAELERRGVHDPGRHDPALAALDWRGFTAGELHVLPPVVARVDAGSLRGAGLGALSRLLCSGRPVQVLVHPGGGDDESTPPAFRLELSYLGVAHREAFVQQTTAARPRHLLEGLQRALAGTRPALHVVDDGFAGDGTAPRLGAFLHGGAAIEGRAHPLFHYDPEAGTTWARRLDFGANPEPDEDWPTGVLSRAASADNGTPTELRLPFTFADFALLEPGYADRFALVPDELGGDELRPLAEYLELDPEEAGPCLPFVWVGGEGGVLHRAVVRRDLVGECHDRLGFWRTLQELAGVRNEHVREAVERARREVAEASAREREELEARHREELERVRAEAAGTAMEGLARMLLELDPLATGPGVSTTPPPAVEEPDAPDVGAEASPEGRESPAPEPEPDTGDEDDDGPDEPWIETPRCSSCGDCIDINPVVFVYDENKQAHIGDPSKGTFAQLVLAAEKCPVSCIHPGRPRDPEEPGLDGLVERAERFH